MSVIVLIVEDDESSRKRYSGQLSEAGYNVVTAGTGIEAIGLSRNTQIEIAVLDRQLSDSPNDMDGLDTLERLRLMNQNMEAIVIDGYRHPSHVIRSTNLGAEYISKPVAKDTLLRYVTNATKKLELKKSGLKAVLLERPFPELMGTSKVLITACEKAKKAANLDDTILMLGETGTGKSMMAGLIHKESRRRTEPFITVDCPNIPVSIAESELFGHERGAFTDAKEMKEGKFELAGQGTIFLDEVGELSVELQPKLLGVMGNGTFQRIGGNKVIRLQARLIFATEKDLDAEVKSGNFRLSLYHRLDAIRIYLPPLRESKSDIPLLADHFIRHFAEKYDLTGEPPKLSQASLEFLCDYSYPGNIRELKNMIGQAIFNCDGDTIEPRHLPLKRLERDFGGKSESINEDLGSLSFNEAKKIVVARFERDYILHKMEEAKTISEAADLAGLDRKTFSNKMKEYDIKR
jgi:DNA-binding NtrC family response regulator